MDSKAKETGKTGQTGETSQTEQTEATGQAIQAGEAEQAGETGKAEELNASAVQVPNPRASGVKIRLILFALLALALILAALFADRLCPYDPFVQNLSGALAPPSAAHPFGTDRYGRDLLSRVLIGSRTSVFSALLLVSLITALGTAAGITCGWHGGWLDAALMRTADLFLAIPGLVLALAAAGVLGGGMNHAVLALAAVSWPKYARIARSQTLSRKDAPYIRAARLSGCGTGRILVRHILPNILGPVLVTSALDIGTMLMELAGLSFLGLGAQPPTAEWGSMMSDARSMLQTCPWTAFAPGSAIFLSVMVFNLLGDAVRDCMDPKMRGR